ncbi:Uncharacterised protein [Legionella busanensis]|uniref:Glycosyltransferase RgtA/B/C/D-like domain-containing protein n=1 Tax=Legionella busanensis TaxID=190655 RepID=A0A378JGU5_9GAMM|nr:hypothetical protein [Legionella busanensis]STX50217.1 Uncharacterised protein [Legionella busanensis]
MEIRQYNKIIWILLFLPILSLILQEIAWLRYSIDIPLLDDWRAYIIQEVGSFKLKDLFASANDTLYPVGKVLDALAYRAFQGNTIVYQFVSMFVILGALLLLQWRLLHLALNNRLLAASAFTLTLLMMRPDTYWGLQNVAYHQAIPLVCLLSIIYIVINDKWHNNRLIIPILCALGLISGLSYISGAIAVLTLSLVFLLFNKILKLKIKKSLFMGCLALLIIGIFTTLAQLSVIIFIQHGTHRPDAPMAYPNQIDFWLYLFGKVARSLMLPYKTPLLSLTLTCVVLIFCISLLIWSFSFLLRKRPSLIEARPALIFVTLFGIIFTYLLIVAAGRANLHSPELHKSLGIFSLGYLRFHYFWVTLLWPWVVALLFTILKSLNLFNIQYRLSLIIPLIIIPFIIYAGGFNHSKFFKKILFFRMDLMECLVQNVQAGKDLPCPKSYAPPLSSVIYGKNIGASYWRLFTLLTIPTKKNDTNELQKA